MSIAIIIATHGVAAEQLLKTTEMLIGEQDNVAYIDFVPGENAETIMAKYQEKLATTLSGCDEVLFLVDTWGGSPFNAASRVADGKSNMEVVTGVNVPMLGVKALKLVEAEKVVPVQTATVAQPTAQSAVSNKTGNMTIGLARVDDRLIHGQVATRWTKETRVSRIVVVSDEVVKDTVRATLLKQVAPPGVTAHVVGVDKMIRVWNNPEYSGQRVMLLFTNPQDPLKLIEAGVGITSLNIGGMAYREGKQQLTSAVSVNSEDVNSFKRLKELGIELDVRKVSSDSKTNMMDLLKKANLV